MCNVGDVLVRREQWRDSHPLCWDHGDKPVRVLALGRRSGSIEIALNHTGERIPGDWDAYKFEPAPQTTVAPAMAGRKDDSGKLDFTLLNDMPRAQAAVVEVMQWAITKKLPKPYDRGSWIGVQPERYNAAQQRHQNAADLQASKTNKPAKFERDAETNLLHAAHKACSALMELELILREMEAQDATQ